MILRPVDSSGDILPVLSSYRLSGPEAVARLACDRLNLLSGEWWENPEKGCRILELLQRSRRSEADAAALAEYLTGFLRETREVMDVADVTFSLEGRTFLYGCTLVTETGNAAVNYSLTS